MTCCASTRRGVTMRTGAGRGRGEELPSVLLKMWISCKVLNWDKFWKNKRSSRFKIDAAVLWSYLAWCNPWASALVYRSVQAACDFCHWIWSRGRCSPFGCALPALIDFYMVPSCGWVQLDTIWGGKCLINPWFFRSWCLLQHPSPWEAGTSCAAVRSPLSVCVRAAAKQQPGKLFPGGSVPDVCHSWVVSDLQEKTWVLAAVLSQTPSPLSALTYVSCRLLAVAYTNFYFPFYGSIFLMANVCVLPPLPQSSRALFPQLPGDGWGKSREISTITCCVL